jgi:type II secretory pathway pseudopilin PulG
MHNQKQQQHLKTNNIIMSKLAVIVLSIVILTGLALVPGLQSEVYSQVLGQQDDQGRGEGQEQQDDQGRGEEPGEGQGQLQVPGEGQEPEQGQGQQDDQGQGQLQVPGQELGEGQEPEQGQQD